MFFLSRSLDNLLDFWRMQLSVAVHDATAIAAVPVIWRTEHDSQSRTCAISTFAFAKCTARLIVRSTDSVRVASTNAGSVYAAQFSMTFRSVRSLHYNGEIEAVDIELLWLHRLYS